VAEEEWRFYIISERLAKNVTVLKGVSLRMMWEKVKLGVER
jgi:hypothetical protein